jgi:hypothetical protein
MNRRDLENIFMGACQEHFGSRRTPALNAGGLTRKAPSRPVVRKHFASGGYGWEKPEDWVFNGVSRVGYKGISRADYAKMTPEQKQAAYKEAQDRLWGNYTEFSKKRDEDPKYANLTDEAKKRIALNPLKESVPENSGLAGTLFKTQIEMTDPYLQQSVGAVGDFLKAGVGAALTRDPSALVEPGMEMFKAAGNTNVRYKPPEQIQAEKEEKEAAAQEQKDQQEYEAWEKSQQAQNQGQPQQQEFQQQNYGQRPQQGQFGSNFVQKYGQQPQRQQQSRGTQAAGYQNIRGRQTKLASHTGQMPVSGQSPQVSQKPPTLPPQPTPAPQPQQPQAARRGGRVVGRKK